MRRMYVILAFISLLTIIIIQCFPGDPLPDLPDIQLPTTSTNYNIETTTSSTTVDTGGTTYTNPSTAITTPSFTFTFTTSDPTKPFVSISSPEQNSCVNSDFIVFGNASDYMLISSVEVQIDDQAPVIASGNNNWQIDFTSVAEGWHTINAISYNSDGLSSDPSTVNIIVDQTSPQCEVLYPSDGQGVSTHDFTIYGTVSDNLHDYANGIHNIDRISIQIDDEPVISAISPTNICIAVAPTGCIPTSEIGNYDPADFYVSWEYELTNIPNGAHNIKVIAYDECGYPSSLRYISIVVDDTLPSVGITEPSSDGCITGFPANFSGTSYSSVLIDRVEVSLQNNSTGSSIISATALGTTVWTYSHSNPLGIGIYTVIAEAFNSSGISSSASQTFYVDFDDPVLGVTSPQDGVYLPSGTFTVMGTASDQVLVSSVSLIIDSDPPVSANLSGTNTDRTWDHQFSGISNGLHNLMIQAHDPCNHHSSVSSILIYVDDVVPSVGITNPVSSSCLSNGSLVISGTSNDNIGISTIALQIDSEPEVIVNGTTLWFYTANVSEASHTLTCTAYDKAGNSSPPYSTIINIDSSKPDINLLSPVSGTMIMTGDFTISGTASDNIEVTSVELQIDSSSYTATGTNSWSLPVTGISDGAHVISAVAYDTCGNVSQIDSASIIVDTSGPDVHFVSPTDGGCKKSNIFNITGTAYDNIGIDYIYIDINGSTALSGTANGLTSWIYTPPSLTDSVYTITAYSYDTAGQSASNSISVTVDTVLPETVITSPSNEAVVPSGNITITGTASDPALTSISTIVVIIDGTSYGVSDMSSLPDWTHNAVLTDGLHSLSVIAYDDCSNAGAPSSISLFVDPNLPTIGINYPGPDDCSLTGTTSITGTSADDHEIDYVLVQVGSYGPVVANGDTSWNIAIEGSSNGYYPVTATAYDTAGNTVSATSALLIDVTDPIVAITSPSPLDGFGKISVPLNGTAFDNVYIDNVKLQLNSLAPVDVTTLSGTNVVTWSGSLDCSGVVEGYHTVKATAYDKCGHVSAKHTVEIVIDETDPFVEILSPKVCQTNNTFTVSGSATDNIAVKYVEITIGASSYTATGTTSWSQSVTLPDGNYTIEAVSYDYANNSSSSSSVDITVDTGNPVCILDPSITSSVIGKLSYLTGSHYDTGGSTDTGVAFIKVSLDDGVTWDVYGAITSTGTWKVTLNFTAITLTQKTVDVRIKAVDTCGNESEVVPPPSSNPVVFHIFKPVRTNENVSGNRARWIHLFSDNNLYYSLNSNGDIYQVTDPVNGSGRTAYFTGFSNEDFTEYSSNLYWNNYSAPANNTMRNRTGTTTSDPRGFNLTNMPYGTPATIDAVGIGLTNDGTYYYGTAVGYDGGYLNDRFSIWKKAVADFPSTDTYVDLNSADYITNFPASASGTHTTDELALPNGIVYGNGNLYIANNGFNNHPEFADNSSYEGNIMKLSLTGEVLDVYDITILDNSRSHGPAGIDFEQDFGENILNHDCVFYTDANNGAVCMIDVDTGLVSVFDGRFGLPSSVSDMYNQPLGVACDDGRDTVYATDHLNGWTYTVLDYN